MKEGQVLEQLIGYQLKMAHLQLSAAAHGVSKPFGISPAKLAALLLIRANPGCDQAMLGRALEVNRSSTMKLINILAERGLVERRPGRDQRSNALHLTEEGGVTIDRMIVALAEAETQALDQLTPAEQRQLMALLKKLRRRCPGA
jgi:DNA-binding MarR family transcriptional regulator